MSKFEILQNSKTANEVGILDRYANEGEYHNFKVNTHLFLMFNTPRTFISLLRIIVYIIIGYGIFRHTFTIAELVGLMAVITLLESTLIDFVDYFKNITKEFVTIEKLWDLFDDIPQIQGYNTGNAFEFRK